MFRTSHLTLIAGIAAICSAFLAGSASNRSPRTLDRSDLWAIHGGLDNYCCGDVANCVAVANSCSTFNMANCTAPGNDEIQVFGGNRKGCVSFMQGKTCTNPINTSHVCVSEYSCVWDTMLNMCLTGTKVSDSYAPDQCQDSC